MAKVEKFSSFTGSEEAFSLEFSSMICQSLCAGAQFHSGKSRFDESFGSSSFLIENAAPERCRTQYPFSPDKIASFYSLRLKIQQRRRQMLSSIYVSSEVVVVVRTLIYGINDLDNDSLRITSPLTSHLSFTRFRRCARRPSNGSALWKCN